MSVVGRHSASSWRFVIFLLVRFALHMPQHSIGALSWTIPHSWHNCNMSPCPNSNASSQGIGSSPTNTFVPSGICPAAKRSKSLRSCHHASGSKSLPPTSLTKELYKYQTNPSSCTPNYKQQEYKNISNSSSSCSNKQYFNSKIRLRVSSSL